jgi:hypothetical protein
MLKYNNGDQKDKGQVEAEIKIMAATLQNMSKSEIPTDVMGSYTGTARDGDIPIQDADDL